MLQQMTLEDDAPFGMLSYDNKYCFSVGTYGYKRDVKVLGCSYLGQFYKTVGGSIAVPQRILVPKEGSEYEQLVCSKTKLVYEDTGEEVPVWTVLNVQLLNKDAQFEGELNGYGEYGECCCIIGDNRLAISSAMSTFKVEDIQDPRRVIKATRRLEFDENSSNYVKLGEEIVVKLHSRQYEERCVVISMTTDYMEVATEEGLITVKVEDIEYCYREP